jgi:hypothetical protein
MIKLVTTNNKEFEIKWAGVANIDGVLRFAVTGANLVDIFTAFTNPANCQTLTRVFDEDEKEFTGYTVFRGVTVNYEGDVIVALSKI